MKTRTLYRTHYIVASRRVSVVTTAWKALSGERMYQTQIETMEGRSPGVLVNTCGDAASIHEAAATAMRGHVTGLGVEAFRFWREQLDAVGRKLLS